MIATILIGNAIIALVLGYLWWRQTSWLNSQIAMLEQTSDRLHDQLRLERGNRSEASRRGAVTLRTRELEAAQGRKRELAG